ncbi:MAG: DUF1801 domain-containing protein [Rhizobiaceae bacterium]
MSSPLPDNVSAVLDGYERPLRNQLLTCRDLIFQVAADHHAIGPLTETLKWGQPSYLTDTTGAGTTLRLGANSNQRVALYVHCATDLIEQFKTIYPAAFHYEGKRALVVKGTIEPVVEELRHCMALALTYKLRRKPTGHQLQQSKTL